MLKTEHLSDSQFGVEVLEEARWDMHVDESGTDIDATALILVGLSDPEIYLEVLQALEWDALVPLKDICLSVENGWVTLQGVIPSSSDYLSVEEVIQKLPGVCGISNSLAVANPDPLPSQDVIRQTIEQALERRAEREERKINIEVVGTNVILSGTVHSLGDQIAIVNAAAHAPGVRHIEQNVAVNPYL